MKIKFKHQPFQSDAVNSVVQCFLGQQNKSSKFTLDQGKRTNNQQLNIDNIDQPIIDMGFKNGQIMIQPIDLLTNLKIVQHNNGLKLSEKLHGHYNLTIEMETGTGKTYTYIKTMFELNKMYGWNKFIIVIPSVAIREGIYKSFQMTEDHFMTDYGKKARYFIYNSRHLHQIESFASDAGINVMIINSQAFAARGKDARRIYLELDEFQSRRPIDVIAKTNPILIIDEPQSVEGEKTKEALKVFNPLFTLRYSATHREDYNKIYRLDAMDAYNQKIVKKINVKGITVKGISGTEGYLYLEGIDVSHKKAPVVRMEYEEKTLSGLKKVTRKFYHTDDLYQLSGNLEPYKGYQITEINGVKNTVSFTNGIVLAAGDVQGDVNELHFRRIQIRETIKSHIEKERVLFGMGIKVLSLFFIDDVSKYRQYDSLGNELGGEYSRMFEEEYANVLNEQLTLMEDASYNKYLQEINVKATHKGYFSIDKKSNRFVDSKVTARESDSDDVDAYDLIMKDKERLLSFSEATRFIFSHSALKEGWDNPNVFQICTLKHSDSTIKKRQEVGRGLRLCVNQWGDRMDASVPGIDVHEINVLTVVASESYETFAKQLQNEIAATLSDRPQKADVNFFLNKTLENERGETLYIHESLAKKLNKSFARNDYINDDDELTPIYYEALEKGQVVLPDEFKEYRQVLIDLVKTIYSDFKANLLENDRNQNVKDLKPNPNFHKKEFQELWNRINYKTAYSVSFDSDELVKKCVIALDAYLTVPETYYKVVYGSLGEIQSKEQLNNGEAFAIHETNTEAIRTSIHAQVKYDLIGKLMDETRLTRKTIVKVLSGVKPATFLLFRRNPEQFIIRTAKIMNDEKATTIIEQITYDVVSDIYDKDIFTIKNKNGKAGLNAIQVNNHIYDFIITDSEIERNFAKELDVAKEICVYAKLPRGFFITTPVGQYNPDWAIVFNEGDLKYMYFVAETKGTMESLELRVIENAKIHCARKHFEKISTAHFKYDVVNNYEKLLEIVK